MTVLLFPFGELVSQDEHGWAFLLPALIQGLWRSKRRFVNTAENNIHVPVTIQIAGVHREPSAAVTIGKGVGRKPKPAPVLQIHKAFLRRLVVVWKKRNRGHIQI